MKYFFKKRPRIFSPAKGNKILDLGEIWLNNYEQVTIKNKNNKNDIVKMPWGYYVTNSLNDTLLKNGYKTALVVSNLGKKTKFFINLVEKGKINIFKKYLKKK